MDNSGSAGGGLAAVQRQPMKQQQRRRRRRSKGLARAVAEYLVSNSYMYAPLVDPPSTPNPSPVPPAEKGVPVVQLQRLW